MTAVMAWSKVAWYSLGFNLGDKQCRFHYGLDGDDAAHEAVVSAAELTALGDMFRNEGPISYNSDGDYFLTDREKVGHTDVLPPSKPHPKYP